MPSKLVLWLSAMVMMATLGACASDGQQRSTGQYIDDKTIATKTKTALLADDVTDGLDINVAVNRQVVQLSGFVNSQAQVEKASEIAHSIAGVKSVNNSLRVQAGDRSTGEYLDDNVILTKVKTALAADDTASAVTVEVEVKRGVVSLGGYVDSKAERDAAIAVASQVKDVKEVVDNMTIR